MNKTLSIVLIACAFVATKPARADVITPYDANYVLVEYGEEQFDNCPAVVSLKPDSLSTLDFLRDGFPGTSIQDASTPGTNVYDYIIEAPNATPSKWIVEIAFTDKADFTWNERTVGSADAFALNQLCRNASYQSKGRAEE